MSKPTMLYKFPGEHAIHGDKFDFTIVDYDDAKAYELAILDGWSPTTPEAKEKGQAVEVKKTVKRREIPNDL